MKLRKSDSKKSFIYPALITYLLLTFFAELNIINHQNVHEIPKLNLETSKLKISSQYLKSHI